MLSHDPHWLKSFMSPISSSRHVYVWFSLIFIFLPFYFDLTFPVFFHSSVLVHPDQYTDLDNLDSVEYKLCHSAKGSLDAYDVTASLTSPGTAATTKTMRNALDELPWERAEAVSSMRGTATYLAMDRPDIACRASLEQIKTLQIRKCELKRD